MKAIQLTEINNIEIRNIAIPTPESDEVLVKIASVGVNPVDWKIASGQLAQLIDQPLPLTLGWDFSGEVVEDANGFKKGDKVYGMKQIGKEGSLSEYSAIKASQLSIAPQRIPLEHAAALPMVALTSWQALFGAGKLDRNQRVLIQAGAGGIGSVAVQLAKIMGAYVIATTSAKNKDYVLELGADEVINYENESVVDVLKDNPVDVVFESLWGQFQLDAIQVLKPAGKLVSISGVMPEAEQAAKEAGVSAEFVFVQCNSDQLRNISELVDSQQLKVTVSREYKAQDIHSAYEESKLGHVRGKLIVRF